MQTSYQWSVLHRYCIKFKGENDNTNVTPSVAEDRQIRVQQTNTSDEDSIWLHAKHKQLLLRPAVQLY